MPVGFCCSKCQLYDEAHTCLKTKTKREISSSEKSEEKLEELTPISTSIEDGILKVEIGKKDKKKEIYIDLQKQLGSQ
jgi:hypothetical protein